MDKIIAFSHKLLQEVITPNDITVDLTAGKGHDTLFLAPISKRVYSFDIQEKAIQYARKLTKDYQNIKFICDNHINIKKYVKTKIKGAIFNLGYLPGENKEITTTKENTLKALAEVLDLLEIGGRIVLVIYRGHPQGLQESRALEDYLAQLPQQTYEVLKYQFINQINNPPYLMAIERIKL